MTEFEFANLHRTHAVVASIKQLGPVLSKTALYAVFFLLIVTLGSAPQAQGLDPAWMEVQAWAFLNHAQWGRDFINTYGPLGFLHPNSPYVTGVFTAFVIGQVALPAAFVLAIAMLLHRSSIVLFGLFALAYVGCFFKLPGDVSWLLTLPFATAGLINLGSRSRAGFLAIFLLAPVFAAIALTKFTTFPLWVLCVGTASAVCLLERNWRRALLIPAVFAGALILAWWACSQDVLNLPAYLWSGMETAYGYRHAQGQRGPIAVEAAGLAVLFLFAGICAHAAWRARSNLAAVVSLGLTPAAAALLWLAYFTRADDFHWPSFFAVMSLLPFALLRSRHLPHSRAVSIMLIAMLLACTLIGFTRAPPYAVLNEAVARIHNNLHDLTHLRELRDKREAEWRAAANFAALPKIRDRVGHARIDMVTWQQGMVLLNDLTYAPRPVFQSHIAATPKLARLNEAYFLGLNAPDFVLFQLDYADNRFPMSEDNLAMLALLRRYRPVLLERGYLLLQRDPSTATVAAVEPAGPATPAMLGTDVPLPAAQAPEIEFIDIELSTFGKLYTLLFPEPALEITVRTDADELVRHRLIRLTASSGFLLDPLVLSTHDWLKLYFSRPLARVRSVQVDAQLPWERLLFQNEFSVAARPIGILHADSSTTSADLGSALYPGFTLQPVGQSDMRVVLEDEQESVFLHAPASLAFEPAPGRYRISATFGIQNTALTAPDCIKTVPDGVGISLILHRADHETMLVHREIDPFHAEQDRGAHRLRTQDVDIEPGDTIEYRVDPGHGGNNTSCDWSYVRNLTFKAPSRGRAKLDYRELVFDDGFE